MYSFMVFSPKELNFILRPTTDQKDSTNEMRDNVRKYNPQIAKLIENVSLDFSAMINDTYSIEPSRPKATLMGPCFELQINSTADNKESSSLAKLSKRSIQLKFRIQGPYYLYGVVFKLAYDKISDKMQNHSARGNCSEEEYDHFRYYLDGLQDDLECSKENLQNLVELDFLLHHVSSIGGTHLTNWYLCNGRQCVND